ncbi:MAG: IS30 family transposase [Patescibacteria group bacterium]
MSTISNKALYQWIYADARDIIPYLVRVHNKQERRGIQPKAQKVPYSKQNFDLRTSQGSRETEGRRPPGNRYGGARQSKAALKVTAERETRYTRIAKLSAKTAHNMRVGLTRRLSRMPQRLRASITYDNGSENTDHEETNRILGTRSYFYEAYHSWEKGTVENAIGPIRRFLLKKTDFAIVSSKDPRRFERWINNRPRKCLNFKTPAEAMKAERVVLTG